MRLPNRADEEPIVPATRLMAMPTIQRNRLAALTATLILLIAGLMALSGAADRESHPTQLVATPYLHHGMTAPDPVRLLSAVSSHVPSQGAAVLTGIVLLAALGSLIRRPSYLAAGAPRLLAARPPGRGPPSAG